MTVFVRSTALDDFPVGVARDGTGRTLVGYVAVFDRAANVVDADGQYREQNARGAFNKSISDRGTKFLVTYNHGRTIHGVSAAEFSLPLGVPKSVVADDYGVRAEIAMDRTPLSDAVLEGARSGSIPGMSYTGKFVKSTPDRPRGGYKASRSGDLPLVTRLEVAMWEFGPTPTPVFDAAHVVGVRALVQSIEGLTATERAELIALLRDAVDLTSATRTEPADDSTSAPEAAATDEPPIEALRSANHITPAERIARIRRFVSGITPGTGESA